MNVFAKICQKCYHVHRNTMMLVGDPKRYCGCGMHNNLSICMCTQDSIDYWVDKKEIEK